MGRGSWDTLTFNDGPWKKIEKVRRQEIDDSSRPVHHGRWDGMWDGEGASTTSTTALSSLKRI